MTIALQYCHLTVNDADESIAFYGDALHELLTKGVLPMIMFRADDLDATFERSAHPAPRCSRSPSTSLGSARLRVPRPVGQPRPDRAGAKILTAAPTQVPNSSKT